MYMPPFTWITWPVMYDAQGEARNRTAFATSSGVPSLPMGICFASSCPDILGQGLGHGRVDETRGNGIGRDAAVRVFPGNGLGKADETGLGSHIIRLAGIAHGADDRGDIDDRAAPLLGHILERRLRAEERSLSG